MPSAMPRKIIIIGASSGIGKEMALLYASRGERVAITGRRAGLLEEIRQVYPERIITRCFDVTLTDNREHLENLIEELGGMDLLIYNAGYGESSRELVWEIERVTIQTNVDGFGALLNYAFNWFCRQGYGQIALTSSVAALRSNSWAPAYSASKAYMSNYAEGLQIKALRLKKDIIVTDIRPGFVNTKMLKWDKRFWMSSPQKAARQIITAIDRKKRIAYITKRWWLIAQLMKLLPYSLYRRLA
jgi:short-subunit dehydrogenase